MLRRLLLFLVLTSVGSAQAVETDLWIESRGVEIPVTLTLPDGVLEQRVPLVVLAHGHGGTRQENGGFAELASRLADNGIASIRMDFPGCGDSTETFIHNNITNMLQDVRASFEFAVAQPAIDKGRVGIVGYSMGGRLAMLALGDEPAYRAAVLWAPVALAGNKPMVEFFGGEKNFARVRKEALTRGLVTFTTSWGQEQQLSLKFFDDMERLAPLEALSKFKGDLLVLHGSHDDVVDQDNGRIASQAALSTDTAEWHLIHGADHGLGFYTPDPETRELVLERTVSFFLENLHD